MLSVIAKHFSSNLEADKLLPFFKIQSFEMTFKSFFNKHAKTLSLLSTILAIVDLILKWLELIPPVLALIILAVAAISIIPAIFKFNSQSKLSRVIIGTVSILILVGFGFHFFSEKEKNTPRSISTINDSSTNTRNTLIDNSTKQNSSDNSISEINNGKNSIAINSPITTNDNSRVTIANEINYNAPSQRHITNADLKRLKQVPLTDNRIRVLFPPNNNEAKNYAEEIWNKLWDLGYKEVSKGNDNRALKSSTSRFIISYDKEPENVTSIIINSQL